MKIPEFTPLTFIVTAIVGVTIAMTALTGVQRTCANFKPLRAQDPKYPYISPLIGFDSATGQFTEFAAAHDAVDAYIRDEKSAGSVKEVSIYFRNLNDGHWFGINENADYASASLLKVPVLMAVLSYVEDHPDFGTQRFTFNAQSYTKSIQSPLSSPSLLQDGQSYSVQDLLSLMIKHSDNGAQQVLVEHTPNTYLSDVFGNSDASLPLLNSYGISPLEYIRFFRRLYNSTYLSRQDSDMALRLLSQTDFTDGLVSGLPVGTIIAHKYGSYASNFQNSQTADIELHDCGIVYEHTSNYAVCIMTRGSDFSVQEKIIAHITQILYDKAMLES